MLLDKYLIFNAFEKTDNTSVTPPTKLTATFRKLEQALDEQQSPVETNIVSLLEVTAELNNSLFAAMVFCQRLQVFLERDNRGNGLTS